MDIFTALILLLTTALNLALPLIIGMVISMIVQRTYLDRITWTFFILSALYIVSRTGFDQPIENMGFANVAITSALTAFYSGRRDQKGDKKKLAKMIAMTLQPTIQSTIQENAETSQDTLSSDLYYGYIVGFVTQILKEEGYAENSFDFKIIFYTMEKLSNRHVAEAHRLAVEAFLNDNYDNLGRNVKAFEYGFKAGEHEAEFKRLDNLRNIILGKKLHYKIRSEEG